MFIVTIILGCVLGFMFLAAGSSKFTGTEETEKLREHVGLSKPMLKLIGVLEIAGAVGLVVGLHTTWIGIVAASGLVALMIGAMQRHQAAGDKITKFAPALLLLVMSVAYIVVRFASQ